MEGEVYIISAPAGGGKTTISNLLIDEIQNLVRITTCTTRSPRENEINGVDYFFLSKEEFEKGIKENKFLEYALVHGNYYGTPKEEVEKYIKQGNDVLLVIDVQGMLQIKSNMPDVNTIFILPPSLKELENRMRKRGEKLPEIEKRIKTARKEIPHWKEYDYVVINDDLNEAKEKIKSIIISNRQKSSRFDISTIEDEEIRRLMQNA